MKRKIFALLIAIFVLCFIAILLIKKGSSTKEGAVFPPESKRKEAVPACVQLKCYDDSDCGSKCFCSRSPESTLGQC
ncbi:MAG: hypothetical protein ACRD63_01385, partial [Pyrinomonadaceae bacterium]